MKIGIVDVGGGMRGIYGAGVFDFCQENGIVFDHIEGVSAGAANGIVYLSGQKGRNYKFYNEYSFRKEYMSAKNLLRTGSYLDFDYIYSILSNEGGEAPLDYDAMMAHPCDFEIVATDAYTGKPAYFEKKDIKRNNYVFLKLSSCVPVINQPYPYGRSRYYDGGIGDPIPFRRAFAKGCDKLILVLTRPKNYRRKSDKDRLSIHLIPKKYEGGRKGVLRRAAIYNYQLEEALELERQGKILIIAPDSIAHLKTFSKDHTALDELYRKGFDDAKAILPFLAKD